MFLDSCSFHSPSLQALRSANPGVSYVCDPVMGDEGRLYVSPELVEEFKAEIVPLVSPPSACVSLHAATLPSCVPDSNAAASTATARLRMYRPIVRVIPLSSNWNCNSAYPCVR